MNRYNRIARIYAFLERMAYGKTLLKMKCFHIPQIEQGANVLILGGGNGAFLLALLNENPLVSVTFVDASSVMIRLAKKKIGFNERVTFVHGTEEAISNLGEYDWVVCNFFLDLFAPKKLKSIVTYFKNGIEGQKVNFLITDFDFPTGIWNKLKLRVMLLFFTLTTGLNLSELSPIKTVLLEEKFYFDTLQYSKRKFIFTGIGCFK